MEQLINERAEEILESRRRHYDLNELNEESEVKSKLNRKVTKIRRRSCKNNSRAGRRMRYE